MQEIKNARQESSVQSDPTMYKIVVKKGNNAVDFGEVCPYCGSKDTAMLDDYLDESSNVVSEAWGGGADGCHAGFLREVKLDKNGKILWSKTFASMQELEKAKQKRNAQSDPTMYKFAIKEGEGPYRGSVYTITVSYILDKKTNEYHLWSYSYNSD